MSGLRDLWWWLFDRPSVARLMHRLGRHDPWCRGMSGLSCDPALRPDLWLGRWQR